MDMDIVWWHWIVLGLGLAMAELALPTFFIIWFGLAALLMGVLVFLVPTLAVAAQILLWTLISIAMTVLWFKVFRRDSTIRTGQANAALGEIGVLARAVEAMERGEVRFQKPIMDSDVWPCIADEAIAAGERVKVVAVDGQLLKVMRN